MRLYLPLFLLFLLAVPVSLPAQKHMARSNPDNFASLEHTATTLNTPYFIFASVEGESKADSLSMAVQGNPTLYSFIRIHYLSSFVGPVAMQNGFASFRQLYRITENTLLIFDPVGKVVGRYHGIGTTTALYRALYEARQYMEANPTPADTPPAISQRRITTPVPHPLEAEVATTAMPSALDSPFPGAAYRGGDNAPPINRYTMINACLPGLKAYAPETNATQPASVIIGLYPTQPRLVSALQALRAQTTLPCYAFLASDEHGTPFYILSVGAFTTPSLAWEQVSVAIPSYTPVCVGLLIEP